MSRTMWMLLMGTAMGSVGCGSSRVVSIDASDTNRVVMETDSLRLTVTDFPTVAGILWARPTITVSPSTVTVENTRYGSLCTLAVAGRVVTRPGALDVHISFEERLTSCAGDFRALRYDARVSGLSGPYDVTVIHDQGGRSDTVQTQKVIVP